MRRRESRGLRPLLESFIDPIAGSASRRVPRASSILVLGAMGLRWRMRPAKSVEEMLNKQAATHGTSGQTLGFGDQVSDTLHAIMCEGLDSMRGILQLCGQVLAREV